MVTSRAVSAGASGTGSSGPGAVGGRAISPRRAAAAWERAYWEAAAGSAVAASKEDSGSSSRTPTWPAEAPLSSQAVPAASKDPVTARIDRRSVEEGESRQAVRRASTDERR